MIIRFGSEPMSLREVFSGMALLRGCVLRNEATKVFGDKKDAMAWVARPSRALGGEIPLYVAAKSDEGLERVQTILGRIEHGIFS